MLLRGCEGVQDLAWLLPGIEGGAGPGVGDRTMTGGRSGPGWRLAAAPMANPTNSQTSDVDGLGMG